MGEIAADKRLVAAAGAGREAAARLYRRGLTAEVVDPLTPEFATAAVAEFSRLQRENTPGIYREALEAAEAGAEDLNIDEYHGVVEVVQNADDAGARELRIRSDALDGTGPAVVSINGVVASLAVTEFIAWTTSIRTPVTQITYRGDLPSVRKSTDSGRSECFYCAKYRAKKLPTGGASHAPQPSIGFQ